MNVTEYIRSRRNIFKYRLKPFFHSIISSIVIDVSIFPSGQPPILSVILQLKFLPFPEQLQKKFTPYYNSKVSRPVPVLIADNFIQKVWI